MRKLLIYILLVLSIGATAQSIPANKVLAGPTSGAAAPAKYRTLVTADVPILPWTNISGATTGGTPAYVLTYTTDGNAPTWQAPTATGITQIIFSSPLTGGTVTTTGTVGIDNSAADGSTKGAATFTAADFNSTLGVISIDYTNSTAASVVNKGFLTSTDWSTFNNKVATTRSISTTAPLTGGGDFSSDRTFAISNAAADGTTKGAAAFTAADFDAASGVISIDYTNGTAATGSVKGFLIAADWTTFNNKVATTRTISTTSPLTGGGDLSTNRTFAIDNAAADGTTKGAATYTTADFNAASGVISLDYANGQASSASVNGFLSSTDWSTFNNKQATGLSQLLTGTNTFSGAVTDVGTTTNTYTFQMAYDAAVVTAAGFSLINTTQAQVGAQKISLPFMMRASGWKTNSTAGPQNVDFYQYVLPVQGAANPTGLFIVTSSINGGAQTGVFNISSSGDVQATQGTFSSPAAIALNIVAGGASGAIKTGSTTVASWSSALWAVTGAITATTTIAATTGLSSGGVISNTSTSISNNALFTSSATRGFTGSLGVEYNVQGVVSLNTAALVHTAFRQFTSFTFGQANQVVRGFAFEPQGVTATFEPARIEAWYHDKGFIRWASVLTPTQISANTDDYNPAGLTNGGNPYGATVLRLSTDASRNLTGIVGGVDGRILLIINVGAQNLVIKDDVTSTAANRFQLSADFTMAAEQSAFFIYDGTSSRWRKMY